MREKAGEKRKRAGEEGQMRESPAECGRVGTYVVRKKAGRAGTIFGKLWAPVIRANVRSQYCARPAESSNVNYLTLFRLAYL